MTLALVAGAGAVAAELVGGSGPGDDGQVLPREEQVTPADLGDGRVDWLQYADATEGLSLVGAPEPSSDGAARVSYPLVIPEGRGLMPELSLEYDSGAGNGWAGRGWDLSVGALWRPLLVENVIVKGGVSALVPGDGFRDVYTAETLYTVFAEVVLTW